MGQKVNPISLRLGINRGWDSIWFAKKREYGKFLIEDFNIRKYIKKNVVNSGVSQIIIERTSKKNALFLFIHLDLDLLLVRKVQILKRLNKTYLRYQAPK